ncbi:unnamed protein product [Clonostachys rosea]|uniref:Fungal N-terminal domain-containing protein n=1 Tax=Bionectria ochroleuca TaxID=29856 RepID=A0ABY6TTH3_BIOOC|nr:unnamed protein product [Clonostachys rosea]
MNPLSITASTLTVIQAVGVATIGVGKFVHLLRTIDSRLTGLYDELSDLQENLKTIENTLIGCRDIDLSLIDDAIWRQSEIAIGNCQSTINDLARVVEKIKTASKPGTIGWKVQAIFELKSHESELAGLRDKVHQSNSALQTMLHIIVVSLSLRQNASQTQILTELNNLKRSINKTWNASSEPAKEQPNSPSRNRTDNNIIQDLRRLAEAAETFYATASSTAGSLKSDDGRSMLNSFVGSDANGAGDLPCLRYQLLEKYLHNLQSGHPSSVSSCPSRAATFDKRHPRPQSIIEGSAVTETMDLSTSNRIKHKPHHFDSSGCDKEKEDDEDNYFDNVVSAGMKELAIASIKAQDFDEAIRLIKDVVCDGFERKRGDFDYFGTYSQLILCYFFQGEWRLAEPLVSLLSQSNEKRPNPSHELIICNFSHALSLCYLAEYSFDRALEYCKRALCGKRRLYKANRADRREYEETLGLYATIYEVSGDCMRAEIFRQHLEEPTYVHPENVSVFFQSHENLLTSILGSDDLQALTGAFLTSTAELAATPTDITRQEGPAKISGGNILRMKLSRCEMLERDTAKETVVDAPRSPYEADDELSPIGTGTTNSHNPKEKSPMRRHFTRIFKLRGPRSDTIGTGSTTEGDSPIVDSSSNPKPLSRFRLLAHKGRNLNKSRTLRRGHGEIAVTSEISVSSEITGTKEMTGTREPAELDHTTDTSQGISNYVRETADYTSVDENPGSDSGSYGSRGQQAEESLHLESLDKPCYELADTSPPDRSLNTFQPTKCRDAYGKLDNIPESDEDPYDMSTTVEPELTSQRRPTRILDAHGDLKTQHSLADNYDPDAKQSVRRDNNRNQPEEEQPHEFSSRLNNHRAELWFSDKSAQALQNITSQLAIHLSSINGNRDLKNLRHHDQALAELFPSFKALSNDPTMINDIRAVMFTLRKKIKELAQAHEDSGYESTQSSRNQGTVTSYSSEMKLRRWQ